MSLFRTVVKILLVVSLLAVLVQSGIVGNVIDSIFTDGAGRYTPEKPAVTTPDEQLPEKYYVRSYSWTYGGEEWSYSVSVPETTYKRCQNLDHRSRNWEQYTNDKSGRLYLSGLADLFVRDGKAAGHDDYDIVMNAVAFVQSLPYTSDDVTSGHDEYPRYPLETLVDNGGDCEDTAIFMAALLREMGYGVVIVEVPGHAAVAVKGGDGISGRYYEYKGGKYYYLETTGEGWPIGQIPDEFRSVEAKIFPVSV